jgi:hypothetical protein
MRSNLGVVVEKIFLPEVDSFPKLMNVTTMNKNKQNVSTIILFDTLTQANDTTRSLHQKRKITHQQVPEKYFIVMLFGY